MGEKSRIKSKADYLMLAAKKEGVKCIKIWSEELHGKVDPQYVLNIQPYHDSYQNVKFTKGTKWTGSWEIDCICNRARMQEFWDQIDTVFMCNRVEFPIKKANIEYLYEACWPEYYDYQTKEWETKREKEQKYDFVHCGSIGDLYYFRDFGLKKMSPEADIYLERRRLYEWLRHGFLVKYVGSGYPIKEHIRNLSKAKIQFIQSMHINGQNEIAQRFWESLPIGPVLTSYSPTLDDLPLVRGRDYLVYENLGDLETKVKELLNQPWYRDSLWRNGRRQALEHHTYCHRLHQLIDYLKGNYEFKDS